MNTQENIDKQLKNNVVLVRKIERLMTKIDIMSDNERDTLLAGFTRNAMSHFLSINILIETKLYNSAFALVRIYFENIIKLKYMYYIMSDMQIKKMHKANNWDKYFPTMTIMVKDIDDFYDLEARFFSDIKNKSYKMMNDYTHTGATQISRNFGESNLYIESDFDDKLILDVLQSNRMLLVTCSIVFIEGIGFKNGFISEDEIKEFTNMCIDILN